MATALVVCTQTDVRNFDLRNALEAMRSTWKSLYKRLQRSNPDNGMELVATLSRTAQELPTDLQARVAAAVPPAQWPITETDLGILARRVALRKAPAQKEQDPGAAMVQQFQQALAMYFPKNTNSQREPQTSLKNLQIFSPRSHLRGGNQHCTAGPSGLPQAALTDQRQLDSGRPGDRFAGEMGLQGDASLREELALVPVGREPLPAGQNGAAADSKGARATVAAEHGDCLRDIPAAPDGTSKDSRLLVTPARRACEAGQGGASSSPFPLANEFVGSREKKAKSPRGMKRPASAATAAGKTAKKKLEL